MSMTTTKQCDVSKMSIAQLNAAFNMGAINIRGLKPIYRDAALVRLAAIVNELRVRSVAFKSQQRSGPNKAHRYYTALNAELKTLKTAHALDLSLGCPSARIFA